MLTALAALSPVLAQTGGQAASHLHALKAVGYSSVDHGSASTRMDQAAVTVHAAATAGGARTAGDEADTGIAADQTAADAPTSRGPPGGH